ncbi:MAG: hypothetical protein ACK47V_03760, partial [Betaproteobacteria bacterium]
FGFDIADAKALIPAAQAAAPRLAAELKSAVESRGALAYAAPVAGPTASIASALGIEPTAPVGATSSAAAAEKSPMAAEAAPALSAADLLPEAQSSDSPTFSTADVMRWRQVGAEAGSAVVGNAVEALLALR